MPQTPKENHQFLDDKKKVNFQSLTLQSGIGPQSYNNRLVPTKKRQSKVDEVNSNKVDGLTIENNFMT